MSIETMKALMVVELGKRAEICEIPKPIVQDTEIVLKTCYSGVSAGTEMWIAAGKRKDYGDPPFINGYQATGIVEAVGSEVKGIQAGDLAAVFCRGAHAQYVTVSQDRVFKLNNRKSLKSASLFVQASTSANAMNKVNLRTGDTVYVAGQGLVGQTFAMLAKLRGAYVIASDISPLRLELSRKHCADWVLDARDTPTVSREILRRFSAGVDVVVESTGFQELLDDAMSCCRADGNFIFEGWYPGNVSYNFSIPHGRQIHAHYPCAIGSRQVTEGVLRLIESGSLNMGGLITCITGWNDADDVYNRLFTPERNNYNGIVLDWTEGE